MSIISNSLINECISRNLGIFKILVGTYMSSIDMKGFSITLLDLESVYL